MLGIEKTLGGDVIGALGGLFAGRAETTDADQMRMLSLLHFEYRPGQGAVVTPYYFDDLAKLYPEWPDGTRDTGAGGRSAALGVGPGQLPGRPDDPVIGPSDAGAACTLRIDTHVHVALLGPEPPSRAGRRPAAHPSWSRSRSGEA